jgi:two-component system nitrogen regulation response regulator GlnG
LNVVPIRVPPLRERSEDIPLLARHFLGRAAAEGLPHKTLDGEAMERLRRYAWPGNVRELENLLRRLAALCAEDVIGAANIDSELARPAAGGGPRGRMGGGLGEAVARQLRSYFSAHEGGLPAPGLYNRVLKEIEKPLILQSLFATNGNQIKAAKLLGLNRNTLRKKIRELDIQVVRGLR